MLATQLAREIGESWSQAVRHVRRMHYPALMTRWLERGGVSGANFCYLSRWHVVGAKKKGIRAKYAIKPLIDSSGVLSLCIPGSQEENRDGRLHEIITWKRR